MKKLLSVILTVVMLLAVVPFSAISGSASGPDVTSISIEDVTITEGTSLSQYYNGSGETWFEYDYWQHVVGYVELSDGTRLPIDGNSVGFTYNDEEYWLSYSDSQVEDELWDVGEHIISVRFGEAITTFVVTITESQVESVSLNDISIIEGMDQYTDYAYNSETDDWDLEYKYYDYGYYISGTVYLTDGTELEVSYGAVEYDGEWHDVDYIDGQYYGSEWGVGDHVVTAYILGERCTFTVKIEASPIESIVLNDVTYTVGQNLATRYYYDNETGEYTEYMVYSYDGDISGTAYLSDGNELEITYGSVEYNGEWYYVDCYDDQRYDNVWGVGDHTVTAMLLGASCSFTVTLEESPVESIYIEDITLLESVDAITREDFDYDNGEWVEYGFYSYANNVTGVVFLNDGTEAEIYGRWVEINGYGYTVNFIDDQGYDNEWGVGEHTVTAEVLGVSCTFTVTVEEGPFESISIEDITLTEGADNYTDEFYDPESGEYVEYMIYEYSDMISGTVTLKDGTELEIAYGEVEYNGEWYYVDCYDDQDYGNEWGVGEHTVTAEVLGVSCTFTVTVEEGPFESIVIEDITLTEGVDNYIDEIYDPESGEYVEYTVYAYEDMISGKVILRDGTELEIYYGSVEYNGEWYYVDCYDDQGYYNEWEVGEHTVTAEVLGVSCTVTVTVEENPIESVDIENVTLIEGIDSNIREDYYPGIGEWVTYSYYNYEYNVFGTVRLNDGSELVISNGRVQYDGQWYSVDYYDDQGYDNEWEVGEHTVTAVVFGVSCTFTVTVTESDVESVVLNDVTVVEGVDGILDYYYDPETGEYVEYMIYEYSDMISGTVTLKDGTELEIAYGEVEYNGEWYFVNCEDDQNNVIWGVGEHTVTVYILGETCTLTVTVVENNVPMISEVNVKIDMPVADELIPGNIEEPVYPEVSILPEESAELYEVVFIGMWLVSEDGETFRLVNENEKFTAGYAYAFTYDIVSARGVDENTALLINGTEYIEQKVTVSDVLEGETINEEVSVLYVVTLERDPDDVVPGDVDGDGNVTEDDAMYLLLHTFFSDDYPVNQECDFNGDGVVTEDDASYLLLHTFFADDYPLAIV